MRLGIRIGVEITRFKISSDLHPNMGASGESPNGGKPSVVQFWQQTLHFLGEIML